MSNPFSTNTIGAKPRPGQLKPKEMKPLMSLDHKPKAMDTTFDPNRYPGVVRREPKVGLPPLQTGDLRAMKENKQRLAVMAERRALQAKLKAQPKPTRTPKGKAGRKSK